MTWFVTPFVLIMYYNNTMISKLRDNSGMIAADAYTAAAISKKGDLWVWGKNATAFPKSVADN